MNVFLILSFLLTPFLSLSFLYMYIYIFFVVVVALVAELQFATL